MTLKMHFVKIISFFMTFLFLFSSCATKGVDVSQTLVMGSSQFSGIFNPFFSTIASDVNVVNLTGSSLISNDSFGNPTDGLARYTIPSEIKDDQGKVLKTVYTFEIFDGMKFSDGTPVTADDVIFTYKVFLDPSYTGSSTMRTIPIIGLKEYYYDDPDYSSKINQIAQKASDVSETDIKNYIFKYSEDMYNSNGRDFILNETGYKNQNSLEGDKLKSAIVESYANKLFANRFEEFKQKTVKEKYNALEREYRKTVSSLENAKVTDIEGIKKLDDRTVEVTISGTDPKAIWTLGKVKISPASYYGVGKENGKNKGKTFKKGDLSVVSEKNDAPLGAGPYKFMGYKNNVVSFASNQNYFLGEPDIKKIKIQVVDYSNRVNALTSGNIDVVDVLSNPETVNSIDDSKFGKEIIDNLGYGYIGINTQRISDLNVRKGIMHLINRGPAIESYYGEFATIIERTMSPVSWAYPQNAVAHYVFSPEKALEYFVNAGYSQVEQNGKKVLQQNGNQLKFDIAISGGGKMDHPMSAIITQLKIELEKLGGELNINDVDSNILFEKLNTGGWDMWVAGWGLSNDPDMYPVYHSEGTLNYYKIHDETLDSLLEQARKISDINERKSIYSKALDLIMEKAFIMPVYQRKSIFVYNKNIISESSVPKDMSAFRYPFGGEFYGIQDLQLVK